MSDDVVARLRETDAGYSMRQLLTEAADEIERLREEIQRLREEHRAFRDSYRSSRGDDVV